MFFENDDTCPLAWLVIKLWRYDITETLTESCGYFEHSRSLRRGLCDLGLGWLVDCLIGCWLLDWLVDCLIGCWLLDWLVDCLIDCKSQIATMDNHWYQKNTNIYTWLSCLQDISYAAKDWQESHDGKLSVQVTYGAINWVTTSGLIVTFWEVNSHF